MQSVVLRARLESALGERILSPFTDLDTRVLESVPTGIAGLDALIGGLPRGAITEIYGPPSSGRTSAVMSILSETTERGEVCAFVDGNDSFDPKSATAAGAELRRLLWVRCRRLDQVLKTTDLLLQGGGFGCVVMDLGDLPAGEVRSVPPASWFRFQRSIEKTPTILLVAGQESVVKSAAALVLRLEIARADWSALLETVDTDVEVVRCRRSRPLKSHVRLHFRSQFSR
jgi:hypothetical protein